MKARQEHEALRARLLESYSPLQLTRQWPQIPLTLSSGNQQSNEATERESPQLALAQAMRGNLQVRRRSKETRTQHFVGAPLRCGRARFEFS